MSDMDMKFIIYDDDGLFKYEVAPDQDGLDCIEVTYFEFDQNTTKYVQKDMRSLFLSPVHASLLREALERMSDYMSKRKRT